MTYGNISRGFSSVFYVDFEHISVFWDICIAEFFAEIFVLLNLSMALLTWKNPFCRKYSVQKSKFPIFHVNQFGFRLLA